MDRNPFIITSVVGQELLSAGKHSSSMKVLEAARAIGTDSLKLESSLLQALGNYEWAGRLMSGWSFRVEGLEYKHTKRLIQAYYTKHSNISTSSLISACFFTVGIEA